jgi:hypothetical protein
MDEVYRNSEGIVCDILMPCVQNTKEIRSTAFSLYQQMDSVLECCGCDEVEVALIDRFKKKKTKKSGLCTFPHLQLICLNTV